MLRLALFATVSITLSFVSPAYSESSVPPSAEAAYEEMTRMFGGVPSFAAKFPKAGIAGAWAEIRDLELSDKTALPPKTKALIALAVAAQIPCEYCIYADTLSAKRSGASDDEIAEAVGIAALTRHWSTVFHGLQIDMAQFKREIGGE